MRSHKKEVAILDSGRRYLLTRVVEVGENQWNTDLSADPPRLKLDLGNDCKGMVNKYRWHDSAGKFVPIGYADESEEAVAAKPHAMKALVRGLLKVNETLGCLSPEDQKLLIDWQVSFDAQDSL